MQRTLLVCLTLSFGLAGCKFLDPTSGVEIPDSIDVGDVSITIPEGAYIGPDGTISTGDRIGEECAGGSCRDGLSCAGGVCAPSGDSSEGDLCVASGECEPGTACGIPTACFEESTLLECGFAQCLPSRDLPEGAGCVDMTDCGAGLRCNLIGFTGVCEAEGTADVGQPCEGHSDCIGPLLCGAAFGATETTCQIPAAIADQLFMPDVTCEDVPQRTDDEPTVGPDFAVYFEVPESDQDEFYRLPFPNDARLQGGQVDMSGHHNPGLEFVGGAFVDLYLDAAERMTGFSTNPAIYFRFTQAPDFGSVVGDGDNPTLNFVNIDPDSSGYGGRVAMRWTITTGGGKFICPRYMAVRPSWSSPLEHGTTYAVFITNGIRGAIGDAIPSTQPDFIEMLSETQPSDTRLQRAWQAYDPFRAYLSDQDLSGDTIIAASVFTTHDPDAEMPQIREAVRAIDPPDLTNLTACGANVTGPCDDGSRGACVNTGTGLIEIHGTYQAPVWQQGTRPYVMQEDGGDFEFSGGLAQQQDTETICVSFAIPPGDMPEAGWPVSMFAHGTGGTFTSHISGGTAERLASIDLGDAEPIRVASVSIDGAQHGPRRGGSDLSEETLFYNFVNPLAAVGNVQQGAADYFLLTSLLESAEFEVDGVTAPIRFDAENIYFFGHSQGATVGGLFAPYEENVNAAIFSGAGGSLVLSLLNKTSPEDIAGGVEFVLTDGGTRGGGVSDTDPLLALLQMVVDPVDPLNYARLIFRSPVSEESDGLHVLQSYGFGDTYTPEANQAAYSRAAGLQLPNPHVGELSGYTEVEYPVSGNRSANGNPVTALIITEEPEDYDGHFVIFREEGLASQSMEFIGTAVRDGVPTVTQR